MAGTLGPDRKAGLEMLDVHRDNLFASSYLAKCRLDAGMSGSGAAGPKLPDWEEPDWEAPAPAGWWQVIHRPCVWAFKWAKGRPCPEMDEISQLHRESEILAMVESRRDEVHETEWLRLRDEGSFGEQWIPIDGSKMGMGLYDFGLFLRLLPTGAGPPPEELRAEHLRAMKGRQTVRNKVQEVLNLAAGGVPDAKPSPWLDRHASLAGAATQSYASGAARALLLGGGSGFVRRLLETGYAVSSDVLPREGPCGLDRFVQEMAELTDVTNVHQAPQQTAGQRGDRIVWVDEELATDRYRVPAVSAAVALLKGIADALNPALSEHHAERRGVGDPSHLSPLLAPATEEAVLTVPQRAMAAVYPGGGARYIPHTDNKYRPTLGTRANARELTAILYANPPDWEVERDGGALRLYPYSEHLDACPEPDSGAPRTATVEPLGGRLVVFFSALWHEVLPAWRERRALTLWILRPDEACLPPHEQAERLSASPAAAAPPPAAAPPAPAPAPLPAAGEEAPREVSQARPPRIVWRVVGGATSGGITVRLSASLSSEELGRLAPGALVVQISETMGGRLQYMKLEGEGPEQGWVSLALKGRPLLRRE